MPRGFSVVTTVGGEAPGPNVRKPDVNPPGCKNICTIHSMCHEPQWQPEQSPLVATSDPAGGQGRAPAVTSKALCAPVSGIFLSESRIALHQPPLP